MMRDKNIEEIQNLLAEMPDRLVIMDEGIDLETQKNYLMFSGEYEHCELDDRIVNAIGDTLPDKKMHIELRQKVLTMLAHSGTVAAYRQLEKYYHNPDNPLKSWTAMAMQECRMFLEMALSDDPGCYIISGLGGKDNKLRLYFFLLPSSGFVFTEEQQKIIEDEFRIVAKKLDCIIEKVDPINKVVGFTVLISYEIAPETLIRGGIDKCNELGNFVLEHYYAGNIGIPDNAEIDRLIKIVLEGESEDEHL